MSDEIGNAAKMREALEVCYDFIRRIDRPFNDLMQGLLESAYKKADAALAAPARNCDRYNTLADAEKAYDDWHQKETDKIDIDNYDYGKKIMSIMMFDKWLFAQAETKESRNV